MNALRQVTRLSPKSTVSSCIQRRTIITVKDVKYTATAHATGEGRNGHTESDDLKIDLGMPKGLGGAGKGHNPEQLFAMGYSACFLSAIQLVAKEAKKDASNASVKADVSIGTVEGKPGFGLKIDIKVDGVEDDLIKKGHELCPYSRALREGVELDSVPYIFHPKLTLTKLPRHKMVYQQPELKRYMDKRLFIQLNGSRKVIGTLRGYDRKKKIRKLTASQIKSRLEQ